MEQMRNSNTGEDHIDGVFHHHQTGEDKGFDFGWIRNILHKTHRTHRWRSNANRGDTFDNNRTKENRNDYLNQQMQGEDQQHWNTRINRWIIRSLTILMSTSMNKKRNDVWQHQGQQRRRRRRRSTRLKIICSLDRHVERIDGKRNEEILIIVRLSKWWRLLITSFQQWGKKWEITLDRNRLKWRLILKMNVTTRRKSEITIE